MGNPPETSYDGTTKIFTVRYCPVEQVAYHFDAVDPGQAEQESWEKLEKERLCFATREAAITMYHHYIRCGYLLASLIDCATEQSILEQDYIR